MSNTHKQPAIQHLPARRAQGLDEDVTAQPRTLSDELALEGSAESELSLDPEDLGARFLSEAVEQGDSTAEQTAGSTSFIPGNSVWDQTVDLQSRTQGAANQLREPAALLEDDDFDAQFADDDRERRSESRLRAGGSTRDLSLLDGKGDEGDDTLPPELDAEDLDEQGSRTRLAAGMAPEPRIDDDAQQAPRITGMRPKAPLKAAAQSVIDRGAGLLRRVAHRLQRYGT